MIRRFRPSAVSAGRTDRSFVRRTRFAALAAAAVAVAGVALPPVAATPTFAAPGAAQRLDGVGYWSFTMPGADDDGADLVQAHSVDEVTLDGTWHHLTGVYDAASRSIRLYVDGDAQTQAACTAPWNASGPFQLGQARARSAATAFWPGGIDDAQVFTGVLTPAEISAMAS